MQSTVSSDFVQYPYSEITDPRRELREDICYPAALQLTDELSTELFDQELDNDEEVSDFCPSPEQLDALFPDPHITNPDISTKSSTWSTFTNSTDSSYDISQYSFNVSLLESDLSNPSELENHDSVTSWLYSNQGLQAPFSSSAEFTDRLPYIPPLNPAEAHRTIDLNANFPANDHSITMQQSSTCVDPADLSGFAHVFSDSEVQMTQMEPDKKPFKCPHCKFSSARKHNLKTHVETHNKEASKRFSCDTCGRQFTRKHDLRRHRETIHREQILSSSSSSAPDVSSHRFDLRPDPPQYRTTPVSGDEQLAVTSSLHPGSISATDLEDLTARLEYATILQGA